VQLPNGQLISPTHYGYIDWPDVPQSARIAWIFPELKRSLLSVPVLADHGFTVVFQKEHVSIINNNGTALASGPRSTTTNLWDIPIPAPLPPHLCWPSPPVPQCSAMLAKQKTKYDLVAFVHSLFCCPPASTFLESVRRKYINFPGLTYQDVATHLPNVIATSYGHMKAKAYKTTAQRHPENNADIWYPPHHASRAPKPNERASSILACATIDINDPEESVELLRHHADLTGRLPLPSRSGHLYVLVTYSEYSNYIHFELLKSRTAHDIVDAYSRAYNFFLKLGERGTIIRIDNEISKELKNFFASQSPPIKWELVPPHQHRANGAERHIQSSKNHIISALANAPPTFPVGEAYEYTFYGCEVTLNILRASGISPYMSAYHQLHGAYDFYKTPLAPPGTRVAVHAPADTRGSWGNRAEPGWYVGPAPNHYNCVMVYMEQTKHLRVSPSVEWFPEHDWQLPGSSPLAVTNGLLDSLVEHLKRHGADILSLHPQPSPAPPSLLTTMIDYSQKVFTLKKLPTDETTRPETAGEQRVQDPGTTLAPDPLKPPIDETKPLESAVEQRVQDPGTIPAPGPLTLLPAPSDLPPAVTITIPPPTKKAVPPPTKKAVKAVRHPIGTKVTKYFYDGGLWTGTVTEIPKTRPNIRTIEYSDGDKEHMHINEIDALHRRYNRADDATPWATEGTHPAYNTAHFADAAVSIDGMTTPANYKSALTGPDKVQWNGAACTEYTKLFGGEDPVINATHLKNIKKGQPIARDCPQIKVKPATTPGGMPSLRVRMTLDGSTLTNITDRSSPTADLATIKIMCNHAVSTPGSRISTADCADYYLGSPFPNGRKEYMFLTLSNIPSEIIDKYNLAPFITTRGKTNGIYVQVNKGMYGIPDSGRLAKDRLDALLDSAGFYETPTPCLYKHRTRNICFSLIVDDFFIIDTDTKDNDRDYLFDTLRTTYTLKTNTNQTLKYVGITISKDDEIRQVSLSVPGYIKDTLIRFDRPAEPVRRTHTPAPWTPPHYGSKLQLTAVKDASRKLSATETSRLQAIVGSLMWYSRAVDPTMLHALSKIGSQQSRPTENVLNAAHHLLDYAATYPDAKIVYHPSDMALATHSDASYLCESEGRSRAANISSFVARKDSTNPDAFNGSIDCSSVIIKSVVSAASEAEYAGLFLAGVSTEGLRNICRDLGYPQGRTTIFSDNKCGVGIANNTVKIRKSKAIDMRYHWIRDRTKQGHFRILWARGTTNLADLLTKSHPSKHHIKMRDKYVQ